MNISQYIDDNLDELIDDIGDGQTLSFENVLKYSGHKPNIIVEDNENTFVNEDNEAVYENEDTHIDLDDEEDHIQTNSIEEDLEFYLELINIFMKYYNEKFEKHDNFFSGVKDFKKDTSTAMELFFDAIIEFKKLKEKLATDISEIDNEMKDDEESINNITMKFYFNYEDKEKIKNLFDTWEHQIYCLEINKQKIICPSLIICLNYIKNNNLINNKWQIFNLRDN
jgi:hypothetical protein